MDKKLLIIAGVIIAILIIMSRSPNLSPASQISNPQSFPQTNPSKFPTTPFLQDCKTNIADDSRPGICGCNSNSDCAFSCSTKIINGLVHPIVVQPFCINNQCLVDETSATIDDCGPSVEHQCNNNAPGCGGWLLIGPCGEKTLSNYCGPVSPSSSSVRCYTNTPQVWGCGAPRGYCVNAPGGNGQICSGIPI